LRNRIRRPFREVAETAHEGVGRLASVGEAGASALVSGTAVLVPPVAVAGVGAALAAGALAVRAVDRSRRRCPSCGQTLHADALVCPSCRTEQQLS
jgi:hypothetical protein